MRSGGADRQGDEAAYDALLGLSRARAVVLAAFFMIGYLAVCLRLADLTLFQSPAAPGRAPAAARPLRAEILDRNGLLLATSLKMASVYADATLVDDPAGLAAALARILPGEKKADLQKKLSSGKKFVWLRRDVTPRQEYAINALGSPALNFRAEDRRIYPLNRAAAHLIGYTDVDGAGIAGIEKAFDAELRAGGRPVTLTIDARVQHLMREELETAVRKFSAQGAVGMVMDVKTGEILAMVSLPDFDPHRPGASPDEGRFNRAALGVYEMGSTFKLFSTAAALETGRVHFSSTFDAAEPIRYGRFTISDYHAKNRVMSVPEIFMYSSNIGTARMAQVVGTEGLREFFRRAGFLDPAPLELPEKGAPLYPRPWSEVSTLTTSFGHGIAVTPVHLARAAAALVNGGTMPRPTLVRDLSAPPRAPGERLVSEETSRKIRELMALVVVGGTGGKAAAEGYDVGGKTGTAEKNTGGRYVRNRVMSSFLGVFPARAPRYVVLAIIDEPRPIRETFGYVTGGWTAAPVVGAVVSRMAPLYGLAPLPDDSERILTLMSPYLKDKPEGKSHASVGTDH